MGRQIIQIGLWLCVLWSIVFATAQTAHARDDIRLKYRTITTPHFYVHYFSGRKALAQRTAQLAEEAHVVLSPLLAWTPAERTHVVVEDKIDTANGSANVFGRNVVRIFGMPPEADGVLGYYDDWLRILVYHEYVHILHLDTVFGLAPIINSIIGKQINPNQTMPRWFIEGLAVHYESARTGTGRINSALYQMWLRAEALGGDFFALGRVTGSPSRWPFGSAAYLYGSFFVRWIAKQKGELFLTKFNYLYGSRLIPLSMNQAAKQIGGQTFDQMWHKWTAHAKGKALAESIAIKAQGETQLEMVTTRGGRNVYPVRRPNTRRMTYIRSDLQTENFVTDINISDNAQTPLFEAQAPEGTGTWGPKGRYWYYGHMAIWRDVYRYQDLYAWDSKRKKRIRLTKGERAREPAISPDGKSMVYVRMVDGTMELIMRSLVTGGPTGKRRALVSGLNWPWNNERHWQQIANPTFTPDGKGIVFSWWRSDLRRRDLWLYRLDAKAPQKALVPLMQDEAMDIHPHFGPDGLLYFTSDRTGVYNIHAMDLKSGKMWRLTNVLYGVFSPHMSHDGQWIYVTTYGPKGYDIARVRKPSRFWHASRNTRQNPLKRFPYVSTETWTDEPYAPLKWLKPLYFLPDMAVLTSGSGFAGTVTSIDPVGRHSYALSAGAVRGIQDPNWRPSVAFNYIYGGLPINLSLSGSYNQYTRSRSLFANSQYQPYMEQRSTGSINLSYPLFNYIESLSFSLSYMVDHRNYASEVIVDAEPGDLEPLSAEIGWFNTLRFGVRYNNLEQFPYSISIAKGIDLSASVGVQDESIGSDYESLLFQYAGRGYVPVPWLDHHVLTAGVVGGFIRTNFRNRSTYGMGGPSPQNILNDILFQLPAGGLRVRGFDPAQMSGNQFFWGNAEYRFPLVDLDQGFSTTPLYFRRLKGRVFFDAGTAYDGFLADADILYGVGAELELDALFFYYLGGSLRLGYAMGLDDERGKHDFYLRFGGGF